MPAPDTTRMDENVAGSIAASRSASRHNTEFAAKARSASVAATAVGNRLYLAGAIF